MKDQRVSLDIISNLPSSIIQTILTFLPIRDAFRTSVLSSKWRSHCANIPKLEFNDALLKGSKSIDLAKQYKFFLDIYTVLLLHRGPVLEFSLCISQLKSCCEIDHIILHLSRNTALEKFTLCMRLVNIHRLPSSFFSFQNLTHLKLQNCVIQSQASFSRFGRLTSLRLYEVFITKSTLLQFLSCCPLLKNFTLIGNDIHFLGNEISNFVDLFRYLPSIEHLELNRCPFKFFALGFIPQKITNVIVHLNYLCLIGLSFAKKEELSSALLLIASSPNIKKIKLEMCSANPSEVVSQDAMNLLVLRGDSCISLDNLIELEMTNITGIKPEMDFLRVILVKSLRLDKVQLVFHKNIDFERRFSVLRKLLVFPRASSRAKIKV